VNVDNTQAITSLAVGYGLAAVLYGGYWLYLRSKTAKLNAVLNQMKAR
jgi:hypothetical protein